MRWQVYRLARLVGKVVQFHHALMNFVPTPKAGKPVWAKQQTRLPCLVVYGEFQFVYKLYQRSPACSTFSFNLQHRRSKPLAWCIFTRFIKCTRSGVRVDESKMLITAQCRHSVRFSYESEAREILLVRIADDS